MVIGKAVHSLTAKLLVPRAAVSSPPSDHDWIAAWGDPNLAAFARAFSVQGERFAETCHLLHQGEFVSNGVSYSFGSPAEMQWGFSTPGTPDYYRWHHDIAFFFFAIPLIAYDPIRGIPTIATMVHALDAQLHKDPHDLKNFHWSPMAVAARTLGLATALALAPEEARVANHGHVAVIGAHIWRNAEILRLTVERYLGYNHAAMTETGLAIGSLLQGVNRLARRSANNVVRIIDRSTLDDGMWAERSPAYHIHMLTLVNALNSTTLCGTPERGRLASLSKSMHAALSTVVHPDAEIAIFNDAAVADAPRPSAIGWSNTGIPASIVLQTAGYARLSRGDTCVIMDAGPMGPDAVVGHGHADFLSIEVSIGNNRLIVDPGVASISPGPDRMWTRSASSHNGPTLVGCEPAEFFGAWRVGRRGTAWFDGGSTTDGFGNISIRGVCDGYSPWGVSVSRKITLTLSGELAIEDRWSGEARYAPTVSYLIPSTWSIASPSMSEVTLIHKDGTNVTFCVDEGQIQAIDSDRYFLAGGSQPESARRLTIKPAPERRGVAARIVPQVSVPVED